MIAAPTAVSRPKPTAARLYDMGGGDSHTSPPVAGVVDKEFDQDLLRYASTAWATTAWHGDNDYSGYLAKQGSLCRRWNRRWFVLKGDCLFYFKHCSDKVPLGVLFLDSSTRVTAPFVPSMPQFSFSLTVSSAVSLSAQMVSHNRTYILDAGGQAEADGWKSALLPFQKPSTVDDDDNDGSRLEEKISGLSPLEPFVGTIASRLSNPTPPPDSGHPNTDEPPPSSDLPPSPSFVPASVLPRESAAALLDCVTLGEQRAVLKKVSLALTSIFSDVYQQIADFQSFARSSLDRAAATSAGATLGSSLSPANYLQPATEMIRAVRHLLYFSDNRFTKSMHSTDFTACLGRQMSVIIDRSRKIGLHAKYLTEEECIGLHNDDALREMIEHTEELQLEVHSFVSLAKSLSEIDLLLARKDSLLAHCAISSLGMHKQLVSLFELGHRMAQAINGSRIEQSLVCCKELRKSSRTVGQWFGTVSALLGDPSPMTPDAILSFILNGRERDGAAELLESECALLVPLMAASGSSILGATVFIRLNEKFFSLYLTTIKATLTMVVLIPDSGDEVARKVSNFSLMAIKEQPRHSSSAVESLASSTIDRESIASSEPEYYSHHIPVYAATYARNHASTLSRESAELTDSAPSTREVNNAIAQSACNLLSTIVNTCVELQQCTKEPERTVKFSERVIQFAMQIITAANQMEEEIGTLEIAQVPDALVAALDLAEESFSRHITNFELVVRKFANHYAPTECTDQVFDAASFIIQMCPAVIDSLSEIIEFQRREECVIGKEFQLSSLITPPTPPPSLLLGSAASTSVVDDDAIVTKVLEAECHADDSDVDIVFRKSDDGIDITKIRGGTVEKLVVRLTHHKMPSTDYASAFLLTYRSFTTAETLLEFLKSRYAIAVPESLSATQQRIYHQRKVIPVRLRVFNFLKMWVKSNFEDFSGNEELLASLKAFLPTIRQDFHSGVRDFERLIKRRSVSSMSSAELLPSDETRSGTPASPTLADAAFCTLDSMQIARQITLAQWMIFHSITPGEFMNQSWNRKQYHHRSPNIRRMIQFSNRLVQWVSTEIVAVENMKVRAQTIRHFIAVADKLKSLNNFDGLKSVVCGLQISAVRRLEKTWELVPARSKSIFNALCALMSEEKASKNYRANLHSIDPPCIPFLGVYLTDLTMIDTGNPDQLARDTAQGKQPLINFHKHFLEAQVIQEIRRYQCTKYAIDRDDSIQAWLRNRPAHDAQVTYEMSLKAESRVRKSSQLPISSLTEQFEPPGP